MTFVLVIDTVIHLPQARRATAPLWPPLSRSDITEADFTNGAVYA
jgi:hypothetical protein